MHNGCLIQSPELLQSGNSVRENITPFSLSCPIHIAMSNSKVIYKTDQNIKTQSKLALFVHQRLSSPIKWNCRYCNFMSSKNVTDGQVVRAGISVTWNVLSWSGGHEFERQLGRTGVRSTSVLSRTWTKNITAICANCFLQWPWHFHWVTEWKSN